MKNTLFDHACEYGRTKHARVVGLDERSISTKSPSRVWRIGFENGQCNAAIGLNDFENGCRVLQK
mgnify:FL=1